MDEFTHIVSQWETFYLLTGTAAATLIGLLFIAVSINVEAFRGSIHRDLQRFATLTFNCFFYVLLISMFFLIPDLSPLALGLPMLLLGLLGLGNAMLQQRRMRRSQSSQRGPGMATSFYIPMLSLLILAIVGLGTIFQYTQSFYLLVLVIIFLLGSAAVNAWTLLVAVENPRP